MRALTRMPYGAQSTCIDLDIERTAPFDAAYDTRRASPMSAMQDDMLMIDPERRVFMCGTTALLIKKTPRTLTLITRSHRSRVVSSTDPTPAIPALLKSTSMRP